MKPMKISSKEILCIVIALFLYSFSIYITNIDRVMMFLMISPVCLYSIFAFNYGKPVQNNRYDNIINLFWCTIYIALVTLTATNTLTLVNEFFNWLWIVIIPLMFVKYSNKFTIKQTLTIVGLYGIATKQPWKLKTFLMCLIITPFLVWSASERFQITYNMLLESTTTLLFFPLMLILMMLTAGTTEEIFFRGIIQRNIYNATKSQVIAVLVSAFVFALFHLPWAYYSWPHTQGNFLHSVTGIMVEQFVSGLLLGIVFIRSSNLWTVIILHSFINSVWATATFFTDTPILRLG